MRIGELASTCDVSTATVRYYEEIGLIDSPARTDSGYRDYTEGAVSTLVFIRAAKSAGLSLADVGEILEISNRGDTPCGHVATLLGDKVEAITRQIADLESMRGDLVALTTRAEELTETPCPDGAICHILEVPDLAQTETARVGLSYARTDQ